MFGPSKWQKGLFAGRQNQPASNTDALEGRFLDALTVESYANMEKGLLLLTISWSNVDAGILMRVRDLLKQDQELGPLYVARFHSDYEEIEDWIWAHFGLEISVRETPVWILVENGDGTDLGRGFWVWNDVHRYLKY